MRAGSVSPRTNTFALRDQFKPITIGENLVVSYNVWYSSRAQEDENSGGLNAVQTYVACNH